MTVTEVRQALGSWEIRLREDTPRSILDQLEYFGHIAVIPNRVNPLEYGDALLSAARYVGVFRSRSSSDQFLLRGSGMAFWLGDEDGKGDVFETAVTLTGATFAASVAALLPPGGAVTVGTTHSVAGTYTNTHRWQTSRQALDYLTSTFQAEWRVNNNATLDAGLIPDLYVTSPRAIVMRSAQGRDLQQTALPGRLELGKDAEDFTTRVVLLAEGEGDQIATGDADIIANPYNDLHGNDVKFTRLVSESETTADNADLRAQLILNHFSVERQSVALSTSTYDIKGDLKVGDYVNVYDPDIGLFDPSREVYWEGQPINPVALRCVEMTWPIPEGWTVAFRRSNGTWIDLSPYYAVESGDTTIVVGDLSRSLATGEPVGVRPNLPPSGGADTSIPAAPAFLSWSFGAYQSNGTNTTKAAVRVTWTTPLNLDSSVITDGSHYEIRYRVSEVLGYQVRWGQLAAYRWGQLTGNRWGAPVSEAISADPEWHYINIPWGTNETTILELTPGVTYEFQIRGVDAAYPPHFGPYSASSFQTTTGDLFAPSTPAAPVVAGNMAAIQVTHRLGKNSGGTFNLEADLVRLDVHVGGSSSFYPADDNKIGQLSANVGMILGNITAVGTFPVQQTEQIHVKVVAVDRAGNRSSASPSATVTADLIDDSHISSLTVSKLTAGTITAESALLSRLTVTGTGGITVSGGGDITIQDASLNVVDSASVTKVEAGLLSDGSYGLAAVNEFGQLVPLSRLAFGLKYDFKPDLVTYSSTAYGNPTDEATSAIVLGPTVENVWVGDLGIALVLLSVRIHVGHDLNTPVTGIEGYMSFEVKNASGTVVSAPDDAYAANFGWSASNTDESYYATVSVVIPITGLAPGFYRIEAKYRSIDGGLIRFERRSLTVFPF